MKLLRYTVIGLLLCPGYVFAQLVNNGAEISITSNTTVSIPAAVSNLGLLSNEGIIELGSSLVNDGSYNGSGTLALNGTNQEIDLSDTIFTLSLGGSGNHTLLSGLHVANELAFGTSKLISNEYLTIAHEAILSSYSSQSYILGKLSMYGGGNLTFPVGTEETYTPVALTDVTPAPNPTSVAYLEADPKGTPGKNLLSLTSDKYWEINSDADFGITLPLTGDEHIAPTIEEAVIAYGSLAASFVGLDTVATSGSLSDGSITSMGMAGSNIYTFGRYFNEELRISDSTALVALYHQTNGNDWINNSGWLSANIDDWHGVRMVMKRPTALLLNDNNLTGEITTVTALDSVSSIDLANNELTSLTNFSNLPALVSLNVAGNELDFGSIMSNLAIEDYTYAPQDSLLQYIETLEEQGSTYTFDREIGGHDNVYAWYKATATDTTLLSSTASTHDLTISSFSNEGNYYAEVSNAAVPDLTLVTRPIFLKVSSLQRDSLALRSLYTKMNGESWTNVNWINSNLSEWSGVVIADLRVKELHLKDQSIAGKVPRDILDVRGLEVIDFSDNNISMIPTFSSLPNLDNLDLSGNKLEFGDLEPNADVTGIIYSPQQEVGLVLDDTIPTGSAVEFAISVEGSANEYIWQFTDAAGTVSELPGATNSSYTVESLDYETMGTYLLKATSTLVPGLTLSSAQKRVLASSNVRFSAKNKAGEEVTVGTAYMMKVLPGQPYDSIMPVGGSFDGFVFENVVLGDYLAAIDADLDKYLPTYYSSTDLWTEAEVLSVRGDIDEEITLIQQVGDGLRGEGLVEGLIESEFTTEESGNRINARRKVKRAGCSIRRFVRGGRTSQEEGEFELIAYVQSDDDGRFEFNDLEAGRYRFNVEYPGIPMNEDSFVEFEFEEGSEDNYLVLEVLITEDNVTVVKANKLGFFRKYFKGLVVYPNPADEYLTIGYEQLLTESVTVELLDFSGHVLKSQQVDAGYNRDIQFDVSDYPNGLYLLHFKDVRAKSKALMTYKVFVNHR